MESIRDVILDELSLKRKLEHVGTYKRFESKSENELLKNLK